MPPQSPSGKKHRFGKAWMQEHLNDPYVQEAQRRGYRSRAAFKLIELAERDKLLRPGMTVVDLGLGAGQLVPGAARTRWGRRRRSSPSTCCRWTASQACTFVQGRLSRATRGWPRSKQALGDAPVDLVVSDMAPNLSGIESADQARSVHLAELALEFAVRHLRTGRRSRGQGFPGRRPCPSSSARSRRMFDKVYVRKPKSSRDRSRETFLVGKGLFGKR